MDATGGDRSRDPLSPALRLVCQRSVGGERAPVVADEDRVAAAAERLVQGAGVERERALVVAPVRRDPRGGA